MMNEKELLEWYLAAGVDAICGDVPGCLQQKAPPRERPTAVGETASRPAITDLAQMSLKACKNAREVCEAAATLEELRAAVEAFDGCSLKQQDRFRRRQSQGQNYDRRRGAGS